MPDVIISSRYRKARGRRSNSSYRIKNTNSLGCALVLKGIGEGVNKIDRLPFSSFMTLGVALLIRLDDYWANRLNVMRK